MNSAARTSIFCAVWHGDPKRWDLLRGHAANVARQTVPVETIYVFDGGDLPPDGLAARCIAVKESLTVYQAWNVALSIVSTPFVMNLNLDDRLAPDAVAVLESELLKGAILAGGDWNVCYSPEDTDAVKPCYPAERLPCVGEWPLKRGTRARLGSGTGERGTFGPACMWQMEAHLGNPRYPWRLKDGTLIRSAGDIAWWIHLNQKFSKRLVRVPVIIGNYHSHPEDQAEFRVRGADELKLMDERGVSRL